MELFYANNQDRRLKRSNATQFSFLQRVKNLIFQRIIKITFSTW